MPSIQQLRLSHFRNLAESELLPNAQFNIIFGDNASGKTSLLEAIHLLGTLRSFRTNKLKYLVRYEQKACSVFAEVYNEESDLIRIGIEKNTSKATIVKIDGEVQRSSARVASYLPIVSLDPLSFSLLDGSPQLRRSFLDWLVFHVKPSYASSWKEYNHCLKQRNMLLRHGKIDRSELRQWDGLLVRAALDVEKNRIALVKELVDSFLSDKQPIKDIGIDHEGLNIEYINGWGEPSSSDFSQCFHDVLVANYESDLHKGFTQRGCHRSDVTIKINGKPASEVLSRGQKKSFILLMYLSAVSLLIDKTKKRPIFLLDDLPSELDKERLEQLCCQLIRLKCQTFVSSVSRDAFEQIELLQSTNQCSWFHVKHGLISIR